MLDKKTITRLNNLRDIKENWISSEGIAFSKPNPLDIDISEQLLLKLSEVAKNNNLPYRIPIIYTDSEGEVIINWLSEHKIRTLYFTIENGKITYERFYGHSHGLKSDRGNVVYRDEQYLDLWSWLINDKHLNMIQQIV